MRHRSIKSRAGRVMLGAVLAGALSGAGASIARATLTLDLEAGSGTPNAPSNTGLTVAPGSPITLQVYAIVTDSSTVNGGHPTADGLGGLFTAFDASSTTAGAVGSVSAALGSGPFNFGAPNVSTGGTAYGPFSDGASTHVGVGGYNGGTSSTLSSNYNSASPTGWFFAAYLTNSGGNISSINTAAGTALTNGEGSFYDVGSVTFTAGSSAGTVNLTAVPRTQQATSMVAALWTENGVATTPTTGVYNGDSVSITVGSPIVHNPGDVNDNGLVGQGDLNVILSHWNQTAPGTGAWEFGDLDGSGTVGQGDLNLVLANWNHQYSNYVGGPGVVVVPEPASLGLLGIGALAMIRRRR